MYTHDLDIIFSTLDKWSNPDRLENKLASIWDSLPTYWTWEWQGLTPRGCFMQNGCENLYIDWGRFGRFSIWQSLVEAIMTLKRLLKRKWKHKNIDIDKDTNLKMSSISAFNQVHMAKKELETNTKRLAKCQNIPESIRNIVY